MVGQTLTASTGTWSNIPTAYKYPWLSCNGGGNNCNPIPAAVQTSAPRVRVSHDAVRVGRCHPGGMRKRGALCGLLAFGLIYRLLLGRRIVEWGATEAEAGARLPGDELLEDADGIATRAITIDAPAADVWPWLVQMGPSPRGGAYTYDWLENLFGLNMRSVDRVLPEFQDPQVGETIGVGSKKLRFERIEPKRVLALRSEDGDWVWTFALDEQDGQTRLISRNRFRLPTLASRLAMIPMEPGSLLLERKMLDGIKERAERGQ
jgi:hypothetical protein